MLTTGRRRISLTPNLESALADKIGRGDSELAAEVAREVRLVEKAEVDRDTRDLAARVARERQTRALQPLFEHESMRRLSRRLLERTREMRRAQSRGRSHFDDAQWLAQPRVHQLANLADLPP